MLVCISWALTLFFSVSWRQLPWGALSAWEHKGSPGARRLHAAYTMYVGESVAAWSICNEELWFHRLGKLLCEWYLYPSCHGIPTVISSQLRRTADKKIIKQGRPQRTVATVACQNQLVNPKKNNSFTTTHSSTAPRIHLYVCLIQVA